MPPSSRPTLTDVAGAAGVSVATASRALRGLGEMTPETRARVIAAAGAAGYSRAAEPRGRPLPAAPSVFDLVLGQFHDPYTDEVTAGARTAAAELNHDLVLTTERDDPSDDWPARIRSRGTAGIILGVILPTAAQMATVRSAGIPLVLLDPPSGATTGLTSVRTTDRAGGAAAAEHLLAHGARRFIVIGGNPAYRYGRARVEGFLETVDAASTPAPRVVTTADWSAPGAQRACTTALAELTGDGPIGLFACTDEMAAGTYRAIAQAGLTVGSDVLVVGFDDVRGARWLRPSLTTIHQPIREMAAAAIRVLAAGAAGDPDVIEFPTRLVERGSTRGSPRLRQAPADRAVTLSCSDLASGRRRVSGQASGPHAREPSPFWAASR